MPITPPCHQLEADNVWTVELDLLDGEVLRLVVEDRKVAAMSAWRRCCRHPKASGLLLVNCTREFGFLKHATINLYLRHPAKR